MSHLTHEQLIEVTSQVGFAVWQIQILEKVVGTYLVLVHKAPLAAARTEVETMFSEAGKRTLGQLLQSIQSTQNAPQGLIDELDRFIEKRNWLVHHSRHESQSDMYSDIKRLALVQRIVEIADNALSLMKQFQAETEARLITRGLTKEQIDKDAARIQQEWTRSA